MEFAHGVNLGNWLVLEKWMSPQLFFNSSAPDEYYLPRTLSHEDYQARIMQHRAEYITERDFVYLKSLGINSLRIPIPYFVFGDREPFVGCIEYLDKAFAWATALDQSILLDLHTAPLSQNGFDNGGMQGVCKWAQTLHEVEFVLNTLERLAQHYGSHQALYGIEILNEPVSAKLWKDFKVQERYQPVEPEIAQGSAPVTHEFLVDFYHEAYARINRHLADGKFVVFHDNFELEAWFDFHPERQTQRDNLILDTHQYIMTAEVQGCEQSLEGYLDYLEHTLAPIYKSVCADHKVICGEWCLFNSLACGVDTKGGQTELNGLTHDTHKTVSAEHKQEIYSKLCAAQMKIWSLGVGHYYWNYKLLLDTTTNDNWIGWDAWDFGRCCALGWFTA